MKKLPFLAILFVASALLLAGCTQDTGGALKELGIVSSDAAKPQLGTDQTTSPVKPLEPGSDCQCVDGTKCGTCSENQPLFCDQNQQLVPDCELCGCPANSYCDANSGNCTQEGITCTDTDGGIVPEVSGIVLQNIPGYGDPGTYSDYCTGANLTEYYCDGINVESTVIACENGCQDRRCLPPPNPELCDIPPFNEEETYYSFLNSSYSPSAVEFNPAILNLPLDSNHQSCYFYRDGNATPILVYPNQKMKVVGDARFESTDSSIYDLVEYINNEGDYAYVDEFSSPIPTNLDFNSTDTAVIPFMGSQYKILQIIKTPAIIQAIRLQKLSSPSETFWIYDNKGFPYVPGDMGPYEWKIEINYGDSNGSNYLNNIHLINSSKKWDALNPLYALTNLHNYPQNAAVFLQDSNASQEGFAEVRFDGFENKPTTIIEIGQNRITYRDKNQGSGHSIPFNVALIGSSSASFVFDSTVIYYKTDTNANVFSYRYLPSQPWNNISYVDQNVTAPFSLMGFNNQQYYYRLYPNEAYNKFFLLLDSTTTFDIQYNKQINFQGTDDFERGSPNRPYYLPDRIETGGNPSDNLYYVAHFRLQDDNPNADSNNYLKEFVDAYTNNPIRFPNNNLSGYWSDVNYTNAKNNVFWFLRNDGTYLKKAFTEYGSKVELDMNASNPYQVTYTMPESTALVSMRINVQG